MATSVPPALNGSRCKGRNRQGEPCQRRASRDGYCSVHHPEHAQDMKALGRLGGAVKPLTKLRKAADDELREEARQVLLRAMRGEQVDPAQLRAAQSLFSFRADAPPAQQSASEHVREGGVFSIRDLVARAAERGFLAQLYDVSAEDAATVARILGDARAIRDDEGDAA